MCQFPSWVVKRNKVYFLTGKQLFETERGREFLKTISSDDLCGHGTIRAWYGIDSGDGIDKEFTDFSSPSNFPPEIVQAIKNGEMRGIGVASGLLTATARKAYAESIATAEKAYAEARATAEKAYAESISTAEKAYAESIATAWKAYTEARATAEKAYTESISTAFWDLFANPKNRIKAWRD